MSPEARIIGSEVKLEKIFSDDYQFEIPNYQRPYSWREEQCGQLIEDLAYFAFQSKDFEDLNPYFLGSIVLIKNVDLPEAKVIDGQQRLITLTILLSVLRKLYPELKDDINDHLFEKGSRTRRTEERPRLKIRPKDQKYFNKHIQLDNGIDGLSSSPGNNDSQENIRKNTLFLIEKLKDYSPEELDQFTIYVIQKVFLVIVSTSDQESAYRIFSVLNDRGMQLTHSDILKAEIIGNIEEEIQEEEYTVKWEKIEDELGRDAFQDLFSHIRMVYRKKKQRDTVLKEFRDYVKPVENPVQFIDETLIPYSEAFDIIMNAAYQAETDATEINSKLKWLNKIDNFDWIPPAILYLSRNVGNHEALVKFFINLDRLASGLMLIRANINTRIERYGELLEVIENGGDLYTDDSPLYLTNEERETAIAQLGGDLYNIRRIRLFVLLRLDEALSEGGATYEYPILSIEHVLPQTPADDSDWIESFSEEDREELTHCIGNLVLLSIRKNSSAHNYDFQRKKTTYFTQGGISNFAITTEVVGLEEWTPEIVRERRTRLVEKCKEIWSL